MDMRPLSWSPAHGYRTERGVVRAEHGRTALTCHPGAGGPQVAPRQTSWVVSGLHTLTQWRKTPCTEDYG